MIFLQADNGDVGYRPHQKSLPNPNLRIFRLGFSRAANSDRGFALVSVLGILALLMVLILAISAVLHIETRVSATGRDVLLARENAIVGLETALGQLQSYAGRDQAITFPATTYFPRKNGVAYTGEAFDNSNYGYRRFSSTPQKTILSKTEHKNWNNALAIYWNGTTAAAIGSDPAVNRTSVLNPHWVGIMDAALRVDRTTNPTATPSSLPSENYEDLGEATKFGEPDRLQLPIWLVSGNEHFAIAQSSTRNYPEGYYTPEINIIEQIASDPRIQALPAAQKVSDEQYAIEMVGLGSAHTPIAATVSSDALDTLDGRVCVAKMPLRNEAGDTVLGHYAYWVGDESTKANFAIRIPNYEETLDKGPQSADYRNLLQAPQRIGWETVSALRSATGAKISFNVNDPAFDNINTAKEIPLVKLIPANVSSYLATPAEAKIAARQSFHSLTAHSRSLFTNTALGGLQKDLSQYLLGRSSKLASQPILDPNRYDPSDPRFGKSNTGFPRTTTSLPAWNDIKKWYDNTGSPTTAIAVAPGTAPIFCNYQFLTSITYQADGILRFLVIPMVTLWNPYDAPLVATSYTLRWRMPYSLINLGFAQKIPSTYPAPPDISLGKKIGDYLVRPADALAPYAHTGSYFANTSSLPLYGPRWQNPSEGDCPQYRFQPCDSQNSADNVSLDNDTPAATWLTFEIPAVAFAPGEVKTFEISQTTDWDSADEGLVPPSKQATRPIPLGETSAGDFPRAVSWPFARLHDLEPLDLPDPADANDYSLFFHATTTFAGHAALELLDKNSGSTLWKIKNLGIELGRAIDGTTGDSENPSSWHRIYRHDKWKELAGTVPADNRESKYLRSYCAFIAPFTPTSTDIWNSNVNAPSRNLFCKCARIFANYNMGAASLDMAPHDSRRNLWPANNPDHMGQFSLVTNAYANQWLPRSDADGAFTVKLDGNDGLQNRALRSMPILSARRAEYHLLSLGHLQQANLSPYFWQPLHSIANSEASPYIDRNKVAGIETYSVGSPTGSAPFPNDPLNRALDISYLLNENIWDSYFLSGISSAPDLETPLPNNRIRFAPEATTAEAAELCDFDTAAAYLQNMGALNINSTSVDAWKALLTAFLGLEVVARDGESNNKPLSSIDPVTGTKTFGSRPANIPITSRLDPANGTISLKMNTDNTPTAITAADCGMAIPHDYSKIFNGFRYLPGPDNNNSTSVADLAERIVDEIRLRGPFFSIADFVNRRLVAPDGATTPGSAWTLARTTNPAFFMHPDTLTFGLDTATYNPLAGLPGINGTIQRAINTHGINVNSSPTNRVFKQELNLSNIPSYGNDTPMIMPSNLSWYLDSEHLAGAPAGEQGALLSHTPGFVTQADILALIAPALAARGDTFIIRTYGDSIDKAGRILARVWLEAIVQRTAAPVAPHDSDPWRYTDKFGRRFKVIKIRWLNPSEV